MPKHLKDSLNLWRKSTWPAPGNHQLALPPLLRLGRRWKRGEKGGVLDDTVRGVVKHLAGVEDVDLDLDGLCGPPKLRGSVVDVERGRIS